MERLKKFLKAFFSGDRLKIFRRPFFFCRSPEKFLRRPLFWRTLSLVSLVLGLEHSCPWPREGLSSERLSLALASDFFCILGLEPWVLDCTSDEQNDGSNRWTLKCVLKAKDVLEDSTSVQYTQTVYRTEQKEWLRFEKEPRLC